MSRSEPPIWVPITVILATSGWIAIVIYIYFSYGLTAAILANSAVSLEFIRSRAAQRLPRREQETRH